MASTLIPPGAICQALARLAAADFTDLNHNLLTELPALDDLSTALARDVAKRQEIGEASPSIWPGLHSLWTTLSTHAVDAEPIDISNKITLSAARLTRNLLPGCPNNQRLAYEYEPHLRKLLHRMSALAIAQDPGSHPATRMVVQALVNSVTGNDILIARLWHTYMALPDEQNILIRILAHPDPRTVGASIVLISNCIFDCPSRMQLLVSSAAGKRVCVALLDLLATRLDAHEDSDHGEIFDLTWGVFARLLDHGFLTALLGLTDQEEIVTPHQMTLLKVVDSYLLRASKQSASDSLPLSRLADFTSQLLPQFFMLAEYVQTSIRRSLGTGTPSTEAVGGARDGTEEAGRSPVENVDLVLPDVCAATVLVVQCLCTACLAESGERVRDGAAASDTDTNPKTLLACASTQGGGVVEHIVEMLRLLDAFLPRITLVKTSRKDVRPFPPAGGGPTAGVGVSVGVGSRGDGNETQGLNYLKRDLVRLLGVLCFERRAVQDCVRACGGITVVMNLCVVDERNPYLREHALFTLRNILHGNLENQAVVDEIQPMGTWDEEGVWRAREARA